jgi:molecular chaperone GrpE
MNENADIEVRAEAEAKAAPHLSRLPPEPAESPEKAAPAAATADATADELAALKDRMLRLQADFDNYRKRVARDREDHKRCATEKILGELLPVADHFEMGLEQARRQHVRHSVVEGLAMVHAQLMKVLEESGVAVIPAEGECFDPRVHECVAHHHSDKLPENTVIRETRRGYRLGKHVLRAAQVVVSSGPARSHAEQVAAEVPVPE